MFSAVICLWLASSNLVILASQKLYFSTKEKCLILNEMYSLRDVVIIVSLMHAYLNVHLLVFPRSDE